MAMETGYFNQKKKKTRNCPKIGAVQCTLHGARAMNERAVQHARQPLSFIRLETSAVGAIEPIFPLAPAAFHVSCHFCPVPQTVSFIHFFFFFLDECFPWPRTVAMTTVNGALSVSYRPRERQTWAASHTQISTNHLVVTTMALPPLHSIAQFGVHSFNSFNKSCTEFQGKMAPTFGRRSKVPSIIGTLRR